MRKTPQQARSRALVDRIVAAGRAVLVENGYDACSTNRIAARAGVSPGSLYQYFPDKASIIGAVIEQYSVEVSDRVANALADRIGGVGNDPAREVADALLAALEADRELLRVVTEELPGSSNRPRRLALEQRVSELMTAALRASNSPAAAAAPVMSWVLVLAVENLAVRWVLDQPPISREQLLDELVALSMSYLARVDR